MRYALILMLLSGCETRPAAGKVAVHERSPPAADVQTQAKLAALEQHVCRLEVALANLKPKAARVERVPIGGVSAGWCTLCPKSKAELAKSTRMYVTWYQFDPNARPTFEALPGYYWVVKGKFVQPKRVGYLTEQQLWDEYQASLKGNP